METGVPGHMKREKFPWKRDYQFVEPGINAEGVRIYPFDRSFPLDVSFQIVSGPKHVRLNRHEFFEVMYMFRGRTEIQVRDAYFPVGPGDLVVMGPHRYHRVLHSPNSEVKLISLNFQPEIVRSGSTDPDGERFLSPFLYQDSQFPHVITGSRGVSRGAFDLILKMHRELPARTSFRRLAVRTYLRMLLLTLLRHYAQYFATRRIMDRKETDQRRLQPLFRLLDDSLAETITVQDAARVCAMSASHFMRFFKITVGQPFRAYLTSFRIAKARYLLSNSDSSIAEISEQVGFCSQSYFGEVFRSQVGMTPRAYRLEFGGKGREQEARSDEV